VSNLVQTATGDGRRLRTYGGVGTRRLVARRISKAEQFRQYAQEDLGWVGSATTEDEKRALLELARHWMQVAVPSEGKVAVLQK
jgi:hypothetical protein